MVSASNLVMYIIMTYRTKDNIVRAGCAVDILKLPLNFLLQLQLFQCVHVSSCFLCSNLDDIIKIFNIVLLILFQPLVC